MAPEDTKTLISLPDECILLIGEQLHNLWSATISLALACPQLHAALKPQLVELKSWRQSLRGFNSLRKQHHGAKLRDAAASWVREHKMAPGAAARPSTALVAFVREAHALIEPRLLGERTHRRHWMSP